MEKYKYRLQTFWENKTPHEQKHHIKGEQWPSVAAAPCELPQHGKNISLDLCVLSCSSWRQNSDPIQSLSLFWKGGGLLHILPGFGMQTDTLLLPLGCSYPAYFSRKKETAEAGLLLQFASLWRNDFTSWRPVSLRQVFVNSLLLVPNKKATQIARMDDLRAFKKCLPVSATINSTAETTALHFKYMF